MVSEGLSYSRILLVVAFVSIVSLVIIGGIQFHLLQITIHMILRIQQVQIVHLFQVESPLTTDQPSYNYGGGIDITIHELPSSYTPGQLSAVLEITNPVGGVMGVIQTQQLSNIVFGTNTSQWQLSGTYTVLVQIGTCNTAQTTFQFTGLSGNISNPPPNQQPLPIPIPQAANEIDMTPGAGSSASAPCVAVNNCFTPNPLNIPPGTTVTWKNTDTISHYVSSGKSTDATTGTIFDSGNLIKPQGTYQFTFANAGTFNYFCTVHPWMTGQVIVGSRVQSPPTQPTPQSPSPQPNPQQSSPPTVSPSEPPVTPSLLVNKFAQTIQVGDEPMGIAYDSGKGELFVTNFGAGVW